MVRYSKGRAEEGFVCIAEVRVAMIQNFASLGHAFNMLIKFMEHGFQISLIKIPNYIKCSLRICGFQLHKVQLSYFRAVKVSAWGGYRAVIIIEENSLVR